jgi:porin
MYDLNSEFDAMDAAGVFLNSSQGIGAEYAQSGRNGPSIFPVTSLAGRLQLRFGKTALLRYALLDGVPGDPDDPIDSGIELGGEDGLLHALEYEVSLSERLRFTLGGWLYSAEFERVDGAGPPEDGNGGVYSSLEWKIAGHGGDGAAIDAYFRYGVANEDLNPARSYFGAGIVATGLSARRPEDKLGLAVASVHFGKPYRATAGFETHETVIELTYRAPLNDWITIQPDVQYVRNPGGDPLIEDSLVVGLRVLFSGARRWR